MSPTSRGDVLRPRAGRFFLEIDGIEISRASNDDVYDLVTDVVADQATVDTITEQLRQLAI
jgi:death on curing protein